MKKIILILFVAVLTTSVSAQGFKIGVKLGSNITDVTGIQFKDGFNYGYHAGVFSEIMFSKFIGIQPEALWSQTELTRANTISSIYQPSLGTLTSIELTYLSLPVLLNIRPTKLITLQAGPQFGILVDKTQTATANAGNAFKNGDLSMVGGVQFNLFKLKFYGRYLAGLNNINDLSDQDKWKSKSYQLGVSLAF
jgi:hypothetical protein